MEHIRDTCATLLLAAKQLLERTKELTGSKPCEEGHSNSDDTPSSICDLEQGPSPSGSGSLTEGSLTPTESVMWDKGLDMVSLDSDDWTGCNVWNSGDDAGVDCVPSSANYSFGPLCDGGNWPTLQGDNWPCFPG